MAELSKDSPKSSEVRSSEDGPSGAAASWAPYATIISSTPQLLHSIAVINNAKLYSLALKGHNVSCLGSVSILQICVAGHTYLYDVHELGQQVFEASNQGTSLRRILEDESRLKVVFDARNTANALCTLHQIRLHGVLDVQLLHLQTRPPAAQRYFGRLSTAVKHARIISKEEFMEWQDARNAFLELYLPSLGGTSALLYDRPFSNCLIAYCCMDVRMLEPLYTSFTKRISSVKMMSVQQRTRQRLQEAESTEYRPYAEEAAVVQVSTNGTRMRPGNDQALDFAAQSRTLLPHGT